MTSGDLDEALDAVLLSGSSGDAGNINDVLLVDLHETAGSQKLRFFENADFGDVAKIGEIVLGNCGLFGNSGRRNFTYCERGLTIPKIALFFAPKNAACGSRRTSLAWLYLVAAARLMTMSHFPPSSSKTLSMVAGARKKGGKCGENGGEG